MIFSRREFSFVNRFKGDFEAKTWKYFRYFERDPLIKMQNDIIGAWIRMTDNAFWFLVFVQVLINDRRVVTPRESKRF